MEEFLDDIGIRVEVGVDNKTLIGIPIGLFFALLLALLLSGLLLQKLK